MGGGGVNTEAMKVAKTAAATSYEDEEVRNAGDNTRRRLAAMNSRDKTKSFWTAMVNTQGNNNGKTTLG